MARRLAQDLGKTAAPLSPSDVIALKSYAWPGNARELRNVIERALITSPDGRLRLDRILPEPVLAAAPPRREDAPRADSILTDVDLRRVERDNMVAALERAGWRIGGERGAAELLGISPSTFKSRMKALAIVRRPQSDR
jgi:transcriptional regulator of acetoin/glycerol metabolism